MAVIRAELEYMAEHLGAEEFRAAALREVERLQAERDAAQAAIGRARALHAPDQYGDCPACGLTSYEEAIPWADCATTAALDGDTTEEDRDGPVQPHQGR